jgi:hypothetical protein
MHCCRRDMSGIGFRPGWDQSAQQQGARLILRFLGIRQDATFLQLGHTLAGSLGVATLYLFHDQHGDEQLITQSPVFPPIPRRLLLARD